MMTSILLRNISFHARRIHLSHYSLKSSSPSLLTFFKPTSFFSSRSDPPPPSFSHTHEKNKNQQSLDIEEISNEGKITTNSSELIGFCFFLFLCSPPV
jgi:hypothetical protein